MYTMYTLRCNTDVDNEHLWCQENITGQRRHQPPLPTSTNYFSMFCQFFNNFSIYLHLFSLYFGALFLRENVEIHRISMIFSARNLFTNRSYFSPLPCYVQLPCFIGFFFRNIISDIILYNHTLLRLLFILIF